MSQIKNGVLDQYEAEPFEQQQFGTAGLKALRLACDDLVVITKYTSSSAMGERPSELDQRF